MGKVQNEKEQMVRMAGGAPKAVREAVGSAEFRGFINLDLSDEQKAAFPGWLDSIVQADFMDDYCKDGVVLSVKADSKGGGYMASATQKRVGSANAGLACTARARDSVTALQRLLYTLALLGSDWEKTQPLANPDRW